MIAKRKAQRKADEAKAAMAYMRRLHGDPTTVRQWRTWRTRIMTWRI